MLQRWMSKKYIQSYQSYLITYFSLNDYFKETVNLKHYPNLIGY